MYHPLSHILKVTFQSVSYKVSDGFAGAMLQGAQAVLVLRREARPADYSFPFEFILRDTESGCLDEFHLLF
jgi:hypothetical protein